MNLLYIMKDEFFTHGVKIEFECLYFLLNVFLIFDKQYLLEENEKNISGCGPIKEKTTTDVLFLVRRIMKDISSSKFLALDV